MKRKRKLGRRRCRLESFRKHARLPTGIAVFLRSVVQHEHDCTPRSRGRRIAASARHSRGNYRESRMLAHRNSTGPAQRFRDMFRLERSARRTCEICLRGHSQRSRTRSCFDSAPCAQIETLNEPGKRPRMPGKSCAINRTTQLADSTTRTRWHSQKKRSRHSGKKSAKTSSAGGRLGSNHAAKRTRHRGEQRIEGRWQDRLEEPRANQIEGRSKGSSTLGQPRAITYATDRGVAWFPTAICCHKPESKSSARRYRWSPKPEHSALAGNA